MKNQNAINQNAKIMYNRIFKNCNNFVWKQFNQKNCYVSQCLLNRYFLVKSYNTIVAIIDDQKGDLYELNKYSRTTSKQITQLFNLPDIISYKKYGFSKLENRYLCTNNLTTW